MNSVLNPLSFQLSDYLSFFKPVAFASLLTASTSLSADVMLGAYLPNDGFSRQVIRDFNNVTPKNLAYVNVFSAFSHDWDNLYWQSTNVVSEGAIPMISWMPVDLNRPNDNLLPEIAIGLWDDYLIQWGTKLNAWVNSYPKAEEPRLAIRFAHEFNGNWYPYSNTPIAYKAAWQHIHDTFESMGVNQHVDWVWSASKTNVDSFSDFTVYYPGDNYVDWTSLDGYNWGSNYSPNGWTSFKDLFTNSYLTLVTNYPDKPIMIAETASAEPSDIPNTVYGMYGDNSDAMESKSVWIAEMLNDIESDFPAVRAVSLFNINKELNWSISEEINTGMDSWVSGTQSDHYTSSYLIASNLTNDILVIESPRKKTKGKRNGREKPRSKRANLAFKNGFLQNEYQTSFIDSSELTFTSMNARRMSKSEQTKLARSHVPKQVNTRPGKALTAKLRKLEKSERAALIKRKLSVIDY